MPDSDSPRLCSLPWSQWIGRIATAIVLLCLLAIGIPAMLHLREAARRTDSRNCLKQLGLALHNYHDTFSVFPPGGVFDREGRGYHESTLPLTSMPPPGTTTSISISPGMIRGRSICSATSAASNHAIL
jgi:hypothetical protein